MASPTQPEWVECTLDQAIIAGLFRCQCYWRSEWVDYALVSNYALLVLVDCPWRRPATEADRRQRLKELVDAANSGREVDLASEDASEPDDESWRELDLELDHVGTIRHFDGAIISQFRNGDWYRYPLASALNELTRRAMEKLESNWQSRQKPKLPTVKAPEEYEFELRSGEVRLTNKNNALDSYALPKPGTPQYEINAALNAAYDQLNGIEVVEFEADAYNNGMYLPCSRDWADGKWHVTMRRKSESK